MGTRAVAVSLCLLAGTGFAADEVQFTESEVRAILAHGPWPTPVASDPTNRASGRRAAVELGERLFFDTRLSITASSPAAPATFPSATGPTTGCAAQRRPKWTATPRR